jgi:Amidohydrolase family
MSCRTPSMLALAGMLAVLAAASKTAPRPVEPGGGDEPVLEFRNGRWLGAGGFTAGSRYSVGGRLATRRPARVDSVVDLAGGYVVPPFGEAHNHNLDYSTDSATAALISRYLADGVFYVKNPGNLPRGRARLAGRVNVPTGVDAVFANGLITATGGHPTGLYLRNRARGVMTEADGDGAFLWIVDTGADLARKWPRILAGRPDFIKAVLVHSEEYERRRADTAFFNWRGFDPQLLPEVVRRAHAARLRVSTHVETAADFHNALAAGVDEINHVPGFRGDEHGLLPDPAVFEISPADAELAARRGVVVVTTLGGSGSHSPDPELRARFNRLHARNLGLLKRAGVRIAVGSDQYRDDSSAEAQYLSTLGVFSNLELLRVWSVATPRAIFPARRVGCLEPGCEASFLVLGADPAADFSNTRDIRLRVKDGRILRVGG